MKTGRLRERRRSGNSLTLVDTSCWIEYFRRYDSEISDIITQLITEDEAEICGIIVSELLQGAKTTNERNRLLTALGAVEWIPSSREIYVRAGETGSELRRRGITVPITDCVISAFAESVATDILTLDAHFEEISKVTSIVVRSSQQEPLN